MIFFKKIRFKNLSDSDLLKQYKSTGSSEYVGELFSKYSHLVYGVCLNYLKNQQNAKDAVLSVFEKIIVEIKKSEIENFKAWLHTVTKNYCLVQIRTKQRQILREKIFSDEINNEIFPVETDEFYEDDKTDEIYSAINNLDKEQKTCIELFYLQNKSYSEIAEIMNYTNNQVKSYIQNGKRNIRNYLTSKP